MEWIKVSDKLPDQSMEVIATIVPEYNHDDRFVGVCQYNAIDRCFQIWDDYWEDMLKVEAIAWMPKPDPYKGN